jgi:hypothetical protein
MLKISGVDKFTWTEVHKFKSLCPQFHRVVSNTSNPRSGTSRPTPRKLMAKLIRIHFFPGADSLQYCFLWNTGFLDLHSGCCSVKSWISNIYAISCASFGSCFIHLGFFHCPQFMGSKRLFLFRVLLITFIRRSYHLYAR